MTTPTSEGNTPVATNAVTGTNAGSGGTTMTITAPSTTTTPTFTVAGGANTGQVFTAEDIEKARKQEKDKLYDSMETMKGELAELRKQRETELAEREAEKQRIAAEAAAAAKAKEEEELSVRQLLEKREQEFAAQIAAERQERESALELLRLEQEFSVLQQYRADRLAQEADNILPELLDLVVTGPTAEKIEESIAGLKARSERILQMAVQGQQAQRAAMPGVSVTAPPVGPAEINSENQTISLEQLRSMSMDDYMKNRDKLLPAASQARRSNSGLFG